MCDCVCLCIRALRSSLSASRASTSRLSTRPSTARPFLSSGRDSADGGAGSEPWPENVARLSADSDSLARRIASPVDGSTSPSLRGRKKLNSEQLAASLKSGGFLGRQTISEGN